MSAPGALLAVDRWVAAFNLFAVAAWLPLIGSGPGQLAVAAHGAAAMLPLLLRRVGQLSQPVAALREVYVLLWLPAFWTSLGRRHDLVSTEANDRLVAMLDRMLFGEHLNLTWITRMPDAWFSETMHGFYFAYYLLLAGIPLLLLCSSCRPTIRELTLRLAATYLGLFAIYLVFPVVGPLEIFPRYGATFPGLFYALNGGVRAAGDSLGTAFPSSHAAGSVTLAWIAWRRCPPPIAVTSTVIATMVVLATVYTQNHFAVDALAGIIVAVFMQSVVVPMLRDPATLASPPRREPGTFTLLGARSGG